MIIYDGLGHGAFEGTGDFKTVYIDSAKERNSEKKNSYH